jgi:hypothetical protein
VWKHTLMSTYELASSLTPRQLQDTTTLGPTSEAIHEPSHPDLVLRDLQPSRSDLRGCG